MSSSSFTTVQHRVRGALGDEGARYGDVTHTMAGYATVSIVLYDGECGLCNGFVQFTLKRDLSGRFRFAPQQSEIGQRLIRHFSLSTGTESIFVIADERPYVKSAAVFRVFRELVGVWRWVAILAFVPRAITDRVYDVIAKHRKRSLNRINRCVPVSSALRDRFISAMPARSGAADRPFEQL
jgi:predicted DCC family thiol-disulfide oxidoreductase YuxK